MNRLRPFRLAMLLQWIVPILFIATSEPFALAQAQPAATGAAPADAQAAAVKAAEMAKPVTPVDKKFLKEATALIYFEMAVAEVALRRNRPTGVGRDATYTIASGVHDELQKVWDELRVFATAKNEKMEEDLGGVEKRDVEEIRSVNFEKFHKEVVSSLGKTSKKLSDLFAAGAIQHPVLKRIAAAHAPVLKEHVQRIAQAAK
jgi:hypothetical protein